MASRPRAHPENVPLLRERERNYTRVCLLQPGTFQKFVQSCPTLWDPMDHSPPVCLLCPWNSPGKNTRAGCHSLPQGIFPSQALNPGLLPLRHILYCLNHKGSLVHEEAYSNFSICFPSLNLSWRSLSVYKI